VAVRDAEALEPRADITPGRAGEQEVELREGLGKTFRDGEQDVVNCGPGTDTAFLDFKDRIEDATPANPNGSCEVVQRARPNRADSRQEDATEEPAEDKKTE